jgi:hypothetical protein
MWDVVAWALSFGLILGAARAWDRLDSWFREIMESLVID